jgi:hypothetical protein
VEFPTWVELVGRICQGRQILSDALARRWHDFIDDLDHAIATTEAAFASRVTSGVFRPSEVLSDFESPVFLAIARHLAVGPGSNDEVPEPGSLASPLTDLLVATLLEQIDEYDDTLTTPDRLYAGTAHAGHIISVNVSERDDYGKPPQAAYAERARNFLNRLRTIEARYQERGVPDDLVDLVLTMAAAHPPVRAAVTSWWPHIDSICRLFDWMQINIIDALRALPGFPSAFGSATPTLLSILRAFIQFVNTAWLWCTHLRERDVGELMVQPPAKSSWRNGPDDPFMGELAYLAYVSHSQSRFDLYPEVRQELEAQLTTRRRRTPRADASSSP